MSRYLRDLSRRLIAAACCAPLAVLATEYHVEVVEDPDDSEEVCALVEALVAINTQQDSGGCRAGSGSDTIYLPEGQLFQLNDVLVLGGEEKTLPVPEDDPDAEPEKVAVNPTLTIRVERDGPFDDEDRDNAILRAADGRQLIVIRPGARLIVNGVDLVGGDLAPTEDGGLIHAEGIVSLNGMQLRDGGSLQSGGAIWLASGARQLVLSNVLASGNEAAAGGVIAVDAGFEGQIEIDQSVFTDNLATAGAVLHVADDADPAHRSRVRMSVSNSTFYGHGGTAALFHFEDLSLLRMNNVTVAGNDAAGLFFGAGIHDSAQIEVRNSVLVGNQAGGCGPVDFSTDIDAIWRFAYVLSEGDCPLDHDAWMVPDPTDPVTVVPNGSDNADFGVLRGLVNALGNHLPIPPGSTADDLVEGDCGATAGAGYCLPLCLDSESGERARLDPAECRADHGTVAYLPAFRTTLPVALNAGSPEGSTEFACRANDQRGASRSGRCDAGSIEVAVAQGVPDEFTVVQDEETALDVLRLALGDTRLDPACPLANGGLSVRQAPRKGVATPGIENGQPVIYYRSRPGVHGVDRFQYEMSVLCIIGPAATLTTSNVLVADINVVVEPAKGIESDSVGGSAGGLLLLAIVGAGLARRRSVLRAALPLVLAGALLPAPAQAAEIWVNSTRDDWPSVHGDGECTLREAYETAINNSPNPSPDCAPGSRGADTIRIAESASGAICLKAPLNNTLSSGDSPGGVEVIGLGAYTGTPGETFTVIDGGSAIHDEFCPVPAATQLFIASSSLTIRHATLRNGTATTHGGAIVAFGALNLDGVVLEHNSAGGDGGAIYLGYSSTQRRTIRIVDSEFRNNTAGRHGGAISMLGQEQVYTMTVERAAFLGNVAGGTGGALDVNLPGGEVAILNATFDGNVAHGADEEFATVADAIDVAGVAASNNARVSIMNSTFVSHTRAIDMRDGANADLDSDGRLGGEDEFVVPVSIANSVWLNSGGCSTTSGRLYQRSHNVFAPFDPTCTAFGGEETSDGDPTNEDTVPAVTLAEVFPVREPFTRLPPATPPVDDEDVVIEVYVAHYPVDESLAAGHAGRDAVVDAGSTSVLASGASNPLSCRENDVRRYARTAAHRCDRGAYELPVLTAVDDEGSNHDRRDASVIVDVLANDNPGRGTADELKAAEICLIDDPADDCSVPQDTLALATGDAHLVLREDPDLACGTTGPDIEHPQHCVVRFDPEPLSCDLLDDFEESFGYRFRLDASGPWSTAGDVEITLKNVPPRAENVTVFSTPGASVVLPFVVEDPDGDPAQITGFELTRKPVNARFEVVDGEPVHLGTGVIVDAVAGTVTYHPHNALSPFDEIFTLSYRDACGASGSTTFRIRYPGSSASGDLSRGGSAGWGLLAGLLLLAFRRRR